MTYKEYIEKGSWIAYNPTDAERLGGSEFIITLIYLLKKGEDYKKEWFYASIQKTKKETYLSERQLERAIAHLIKVGLIYCKFEGMPLKKYYKIGDLSLLYNKEIDLKYIPPVGTKRTNKLVRNVLTREDISYQHII